MKKVFLLISLVYGILQPIEKDKSEQSTYYVINVKGTYLYEKPSFQSKVLQNLPAGQNLEVMKVLNTYESISIGKDFILKGNFMKVKHANKTGYVFSTNLSLHKPKMVDIHEGILIPNIKGKLVNKRNKKRKAKFGSQNFEITDEITEYENVTYTYTAFEGCFTHNYLYKNLTLSEVFHQVAIHNVVIRQTEKGDFIEVPKFKVRKGNEYHFEDIGATEELKIVDHGDGTYTISSIDCV